MHLALAIISHAQFEMRINSKKQLLKLLKTVTESLSFKCSLILLNEIYGIKTL